MREEETQEASEGMLCEVINPSDTYTLTTRDFRAAAVAIAFIGDGSLGLREVRDDGLRSPVLFGWDEWFEENEIGDLDAFIDANCTAMAEAMESVCIGDATERGIEALAIERVREAAGDVQADELRAELHDKRRRSLNDIGRAAWAYAAKLRALEGGLKCPDKTSPVMVFKGRH